MIAIPTPSRSTWLKALVISCIGLGGNAAQAQLQQPASTDLSSPAPGVLCDAAGPICYDAQGPSIAQTQTYFGRTAAEQLSRQLAGRPTLQEFRLSSGAVCDTRARLCWSDGFMRRNVAAELSRELFGGPAEAGSGAAAGSALYLPQAGVACDPQGRVCYDKLGLSLGLTREYYGSYAEQQAQRQLAGQAPPKVFRLSSGAVCDVDARRCWSDGWDRRRVDASLSSQLFGQEATGVARQAQCRLSRWFKVLSSGTCEISDRSSGGVRQLDVTLSNGTVYSFSRPAGAAYRLTDGKGRTWPVALNDQGSSLSFSWSDRMLQITPQRQPGAGDPSLGQLIDSLLGN
ncbi:YcgJ family protein [Synechococcus sp. GFB01]|uniref:YcgJ family protein n=1 Tax=Synechococcus sp. GFB01 TaxID=1662190 RepID=UPI00069D80DA|nr:YcgJ family protein [Synechococcus sp. GFB01]